MRKCTGNNTQTWGAEAIFEVTCRQCGNAVEFFKDEITRPCRQCGGVVHNDRKSWDCGQWCSSASPHTRNLCPRFKRAKDRYFHGHRIA